MIVDRILKTESTKGECDRAVKLRSASEGGRAPGDFWSSHPADRPRGAVKLVVRGRPNRMENLG